MSSTAIFALMTRAAHQSIDSDPKILADPISLSMARELGAGSEWIGFRQMSPELRFAARATLTMRSRYAEDVLREVVSELPCQYVILGAGFDTFAYRQPEWARQVPIFEVDHPAAQQARRDLLARCGIPEPSNLRFCPIDFEKAQLKQVLSDTGFDFTKPAVVSWLGVTQYLTRAAIQNILEFVQKLGQGTTLVFSYIVDDAGLPASELQIVAEFEAIAARGGEGFVSRFAPGELTEWLRRLGFGKIDPLRPDVAHERYFAARTDGLRAYSAEQVMRVTV